MYSDLIVGFDGSPAAHDALAFARRFALATGGRPRVVCVRPRGPIEPTLDDRAGADRRRARRAVRGGGRHDRGSRAVRSGGGAEAALIVLGATHRSSLGAVVPGTTAEAVIHAAPCAVAIVPAGYAERAARRPFGLVAAAVDGSGDTERVARIAAGIAEGAGADLQARRASWTPPTATARSTPARSRT